MVCVAVKGKPLIGIIHKPFKNVTSWAWVDKGKSIDLKNIPVRLQTYRRLQNNTSYLKNTNFTGPKKMITFSNVLRYFVLFDDCLGFKIKLKHRSF